MVAQVNALTYESTTLGSQSPENIYIHPDERSEPFGVFDPNIDFDADSILGV